MSVGRLESFSDGVIAVAITLLVLAIGVPDPAKTTHLGHALGVQWPFYAAYVTSFITIGIIWINHHAMIGRLARPDHAIMMLNLVLLLTIGVIPFATSLLAQYLRQGHGANLAAGIYGGVLLAMAVVFWTLNCLILLRRTHLLKLELSPEQRRQILTRGVTGIFPYAIATALAAVSPYVTLAICVAVAAFYTLPVASGTASGRSGATSA
jgi:uncharacterized membrane protein